MDSVEPTLSSEQATHGDAVRAIVCTGNAHKVEELTDLLSTLPCVLSELRLEALPAGAVLPPEIGETFLDNARIKAHAGASMYPGCWVLADDSGLAVDALDGAPGVHSARFAGEDADDATNVALLLERLEPIVDAELRSARFVCVLVAVAPDGTEYVAHGTVDGRIAHEVAGTHGFGYDPLFVPDGHAATFAELGHDVKSTMSHRARAARELAAKLPDPTATA